MDHELFKEVLITEFLNFMEKRDAAIFEQRTKARRVKLHQQAAVLSRIQSVPVQLSLAMPSSARKLAETEPQSLTLRGMHVVEKKQA